MSIAGMTIARPLLGLPIGLRFTFGGRIGGDFDRYTSR
jgi:hypothetical protein